MQICQSLTLMLWSGDILWCIIWCLYIIKMIWKLAGDSILILFMIWRLCKAHWPCFKTHKHRAVFGSLIDGVCIFIQSYSNKGKKNPFRKKSVGHKTNIWIQTFSPNRLLATALHKHVWTLSLEEKSWLLCVRVYKPFL